MESSSNHTNKILVLFLLLALAGLAVSISLLARGSSPSVSKDSEYLPSDPEDLRQDLFREEVGGSRATLKPFLEALVKKDTTIMGQYLMNPATATKALATYKDLPVRGYKIGIYNIKGNRVEVDVTLFLYNGTPGSLNPEAGSDWKLSEFRIYTLVKSGTRWLIEDAVFH